MEIIIFISYQDCFVIQSLFSVHLCHCHYPFLQLEFYSFSFCLLIMQSVHRILVSTVSYYSLHRTSISNLYNFFKLLIHNIFPPFSSIPAMLLFSFLLLSVVFFFFPSAFFFANLFSIFVLERPFEDIFFEMHLKCTSMHKFYMDSLCQIVTLNNSCTIFFSSSFFLYNFTLPETAFVSGNFSISDVG